MAIPNGGLITETNRQYYEGAQSFLLTGSDNYTTTFNTDLVFGSYNPDVAEYSLNNFKLYLSLTGLPGSYEEYVGAYNVSGNTITFDPIPLEGIIAVQLKKVDGGNYGDRDAYGTTVEKNYGDYSYISLDDIVNNFYIAYVGAGKLIPSIKKTDLLFHAKRGLQEFSYDTLKSEKSQELTVPNSLSVVLPQDYVNYVKVSWIDKQGVKHPIYPANNLTINPGEMPIQDAAGVEIQDNFGENIEGTSITEERWRGADDNLIYNNINNPDFNNTIYGTNTYGFGERYGADPQYSQINGWFTINNREGKISFSSDLVDKIIILEYISDNLAYDGDARLPKMAEDAMYAYISHAVVSTRSNYPEYLVQRLSREKWSKLRNAKIRLSNIKIEEITQVMRGKSKWIKH